MRHFQTFGRRPIGLLTGLALAVVLASDAVWAAISPQIASFDSGGRDHPTAVTSDSLGNVYVSGSIDKTFGILKYDPQGKLLWSYRYTGTPVRQGDRATSVVVDSAGNVYATGSATNTSTHTEWLTVELGPDGIERWARRFTDNANFNAMAQKIAADGNGNLYVGGTLSSSGAPVIAVAKYSIDGVLAWQRTMNNGDVQFVGLASDSASNVVVLGDTINFVAGTQDVITFKLDAQGTLLWRATFHETDRNFFANDVLIAQSGSVWITGVSSDTNTDGVVPPFTVNYDSAGTVLHSFRSGGSSLALDFAGNVLLADSLQAATLNDRRPSAAKFDVQGNVLWQTILTDDMEVNGFGRGSRIATDTSGNIFVAQDVSRVGNAGADADYSVSKLDSNGGLQWQHRFNSGGTNNDYVSSMVLDAFGNLFVTGESQWQCSSVDGWCDSINTLGFAQGVTPSAASTLPTPPPTQIPSAPSKLVAAASSNQVALTWQDNANNEMGFSVERCTGSGCNSFVQIAQVGANVSGFVDNGVAKNTSVTYRVRAFNSAGNSAYSNSASAKTPKR